MLRMQYSAAQNTVPVSKEGVLTPDEEPEVQGEEPAWLAFNHQMACP